MPSKSTGKAGIGVVLERLNAASTPVFEGVANVTTLSAGGVTVNMIDATHLDSPDFYAEFIPGLKTSSEWTMTVQYDPSDPTLNGTTGIRKQLEDREIRTFRVNTLGIGWAVMIEADCYISEMGNIEIAADSIMTQSLTLRPSGKPRFLTPSAPLDPPPAGYSYVVDTSVTPNLYEINEFGAYVIGN